MEQYRILWDSTDTAVTTVLANSILEGYKSLGEFILSNIMQIHAHQEWQNSHVHDVNF